MRLKDKVAVITGAASGIGRATAQLFSREGAHLVLNDIDQHGLQQVLTETHAQYSRAVTGDIADEDTARRLTTEAIAVFGRIDILVNNAGVQLVEDITDVTVEEWDRVLNTNLKSMFLCCKHVLPHMVNQRHGSIVNLASVAAFIGQEVGGTSTCVYNITKAGALQLTKSLASRYASDGIRVNCVCPGPVETNMGSESLTPEERAAIYRTLAPLQPMQRNGQPEEIAQAILFLASDEAAFVTGSPLIVDGGYLAR